MPQIARPSRDKDKLVAHSFMPRGVSAANEELSENAIQSLSRFYGSSEIVSYYTPQLPLDTADIVERIVREAVKETLDQIEHQSTWNDGWNGYDARAPELGALAHAKRWIVQLFLEVNSQGREWIKPNVTASAEGEVVFEWWRRAKKLTIYVSVEAVEYVQVWGKNINTEMSDGDASSASACRTLWLWLCSE